MKDIIEAVLAAIGVMAILAVFSWTLALRYLEWYNRVWLPNQKPEEWDFGDDHFESFYIYDLELKRAVKKILKKTKRNIGETYNDQGGVDGR